MINYNIRYATDGRGVPTRSTRLPSGTISNAQLYGATADYTAGVDGLTGPIFSINARVLFSLSNSYNVGGGGGGESDGGTGEASEDNDNFLVEIEEQVSNLYGINSGLVAPDGTKTTEPPIFANSSPYFNSGDIHQTLLNDLAYEEGFSESQQCYVGSAFKDLKIGYNPQASVILGISHPGPAGGGTPGFKLGETGAQELHAGTTGSLHGRIFQILDLTSMSAASSTGAAGVPGGITGGVYAVFLGNVGPTGGTSGRGVTQYVAGGTFGTSTSNSGITGLISYVHPITNDSKTKNMLNTITKYFDRGLLTLSLEITGGSAGSTIYYDGTTSDGITAGKAFLLGVKPNTVSQLAAMSLDRSIYIKHRNVFREKHKHTSIPSAVTGGNETDIQYTFKKVYTDKLSSSTAVVNDPATHSSALEEFYHTLITFQDTVNRVRAVIFDGATGGESVNTMYKVQTLLPIIQTRFTDNQ